MAGYSRHIFHKIKMMVGEKRYIPIKLVHSVIIIIFTILLAGISGEVKLFAINEKLGFNKLQNGVVRTRNLWIWESLNEDQKNNLKCIDLSDLRSEIPLRILYSKRILWRNERWEYSTWERKNDVDTLGYPTVVKNICCVNPDRKYYLFYAHHDPNSGIGCAVSDSIAGPYVKLKNTDLNKHDSRVLVCPGKKDEPFHYSSPCVVWNEDEKLWLMYFHFFKDEWHAGRGHQKTGLATCSDLRKNVWIPWKDANGNLIDVFPTTKERWMNSQSSYHAIQRLPNGVWLAFLRGTGGEYEYKLKFSRGELIERKRMWKQDPCKLGFATSRDGRHWVYFPENPVIHQTDGGGGRAGVYRPHFIGYLGDGRYLAAWSESEYYDNNPRIVYGTTSDFRTFQRDKRGYARWLCGDGLISPWREGNKLYLFAGKRVHIMELPVIP